MWHRRATMPAPVLPATWWCLPQPQAATSKADLWSDRGQTSSWLTLVIMEQDIIPCCKQGTGPPRRYPAHVICPPNTHPTLLVSGSWLNCWCWAPSLGTSFSSCRGAAAQGWCLYPWPSLWPLEMDGLKLLVPVQECGVYEMLLCRRQT